MSDRSMGALAAGLLTVFWLQAASAFGETADSSLNPTSIFAPASTPAQSIFDLSMFVLEVTAAIFVVVFGLLVYVVLRFRKTHPSLGRSRFWREDVAWYGVGSLVDLPHDSRSLAFCLHGASQGDDDIYVMINAYWEALEFEIQEGTAQEWRRIVDTALPSPDDFSGSGAPLKQSKYLVAPRSIVVLLRPRGGGK